MGRLSRTKPVTDKTNLDVHIFIDESGNVTQIEKKTKDRLKYYIDEVLPQPFIAPPCFIGITGDTDVNCLNGIALGIGDDSWALATYV